MKTYLIIFFFIALSKICAAQQLKRNIDYQYYRDEKTYYAFELYKNISQVDDNLMLNFSSNINYNKVDKIYLKQGEIKVRLKFKMREEQIKSDNPEFKFYPITFSIKDIERKNIGLKTQIVFKLDNGSVLTLPFNFINISENVFRN